MASNTRVLKGLFHAHIDRFRINFEANSKSRFKTDCLVERRSTTFKKNRGSELCNSYKSYRIATAVVTYIMLLRYLNETEMKLIRNILKIPREHE